MSSATAILQEFDQESATTRRVLERVPGDQLTWKPHPKSMSLGELAMHVASSPGFIAEWALLDTVEFPEHSTLPQPTSSTQILAAHDEGVTKAKTAISRLGDAGLQQHW